jgi:hypothetical protein
LLIAALERSPEYLPLSYLLRLFCAQGMELSGAWCIHSGHFS